MCVRVCMLMCVCKDKQWYAMSEDWFCSRPETPMGMMIISYELVHAYLRAKHRLQSVLVRFTPKRQLRFYYARSNDDSI